MKKVGIICEYNPFHTGHLHQIGLAKKEGTAVICLMSGNLTQRGELAITDKYTRAACALASGADLVIELPFPFCASSADYFAGAGVAILDALGVNEINFGSESADAEGLLSLARVTASAEFDLSVKEKLKADPALGAAQAYFEAMKDVGKNRALLSNDMLGLAYFRAALRIGCENKLSVIKRDGADYNSRSAQEKTHPSARAVREMLRSGNMKALDLMPGSAAEIFSKAPLSDIKNLTSAILSFFRLADPDKLSEFSESGGGLSHRLCTAAKEARTLEEFFGKAAAKRYTDSRVRRAVLNCMIGVTETDLCTPPAYVQLLAANSVGRGLLSEIKKSSPLPVVTKPADAAAISARQAELSARADALYTLAFDEPFCAAEYVKRSPFIDF